MDQSKKPREANYVNITGEAVKEQIKNIVVLPNKELHLNYVVWYKKDNPEEWGLTVKGFPEKKIGIQHVFKITWFAGEGELKPAKHCETLTEPITGENYDFILNIFNKYKK